jgi:hypothetical protein
MITSFWHLLKTARTAQHSDGDVTLSWQEALAIAEKGEKLEIELDHLKRDVEQIRILRKEFEKERKCTSQH